LAAHLPEELQSELQEFEAAHALGEAGFYEPLDPSEATVHLPLPPLFLQDVRTAFHTYCNPADNGAKPSIDFANVGDALMYAGIFCTPLKEDRLTPLTEGEFLELAHAAGIAVLSKAQVQKIKVIFKKFDKDRSGVLELDELLRMFKDLIPKSMGISEQQIDGIAASWTDCRMGRGRIDEDAFMAIMARYIKAHEHRWSLLRGVTALLGGKAYSQAERVTEDDLVKASQRRIGSTPLTVEEAQELIWAMNWRGQGNSGSLNMECLVSLLTLVLEWPAGKLPPPPPAKATASREPLEKPAAFDPSTLLFDLRRGLPPPRPVEELAPVQEEEVELEEEQPDESFITSDLPPPEELPRTFALRVYELFEEPNSSRQAEILSTVMTIFILVSVLTLVLEPLVKPSDYDDRKKTKDAWKVLEVFFTIAFAIELSIRFLVSDASGRMTKLDFIKSPLNICDFVAILPLIIEYIFTANAMEMRLLRIVRLARLARMARVARLTRKCALAAPVAVVLVVIWGIYLSNVKTLD